LKLALHSQEWLCYLVAAAAATTAGSPSTDGRRGRFGGSSVAAAVGGGEDRKLNAGFPAGALWAGYFLLLVDDNLLEAGFALFTKVFVDGHGSYSFCLQLVRSFALIIAGVDRNFGLPTPSPGGLS
jgi:hypothetical protein